MTLAEQRVALIEAMAKAARRRAEERMVVPLSPNDRELHWYELDNMRAAIAALSAAGFSVVGPEVTAEQVIDGYMDSGIDYQMSHADILLLFSAMLACTDLARKP